MAKQYVSRIAGFFSFPRLHTGFNSDRWIVAAASFIFQIGLGAVYAWSVFLTPVMERYVASRGEANATFTMAIAVVGVTASFGGYLQRRLGPRCIAIIGSLLYGVGMILSGFAPDLRTLYLTYGVVSGIGLGLGYIVPLAMLLRWFPERRGFITGFSSMGFGAGALVIGPVAEVLLRRVGLSLTFVELGMSFAAVMFAAALFFREAPGVGTHTAPRTDAGEECTLRAALRSPAWHALWAMLALNVTAGISLISVAVPLAQALTHVSLSEGALVVVVMSLCNGGGRILWGSASDHIGRPATFVVMFLLQAVCFYALAHTTDFMLLLALAGVVATCFGGGFGTMPAFTADLFGPRNAGTIYGALLTAWSVGAIVGPLFIAAVDYRTALVVIAAGAACAAVIPLTMLSRRSHMLLLGQLPTRPKLIGAQ